MTRSLVCAALMTLTACGGARAKYAMAARSAAPPALAGTDDEGGSASDAVSTTATATSTKSPSGDQAKPLEEKVVVTGTVSIAVTELPAAVAKIREHVLKASGRVMTESVSGGALAHSGRLRVRVPPGAVQALISYLDSIGEITSRNLQGTDVSRTLFDQKIALENLTHTMNRMRKLLERPGLDMKQVLAIETQLTRLRGQIESIKGSRRYLQDRVALATIDIELSRKQGAVFGPKAKLYPGARLSVLGLLDADGAQRLRLGGGLVIRFPEKVGAPRRGTLELDFFEKTGDTGSKLGILATVGAAAYSDFLGRGQRSYLNPYLGFRVGYGYLEKHYFASGVGAGVELFKNKYMMIDANVRGYVFIRDAVEPVVTGGLSAVFAF